MKFIVLGTNKQLATAEISAVLSRSINAPKGQALILDEVDLPLERLQERLAGAVKTGDIIGSVKKFNQAEVADLIVSFVGVGSPGPRGEGGLAPTKIKFGISVYGSENLQKESEPLGLAVKKRLRERGMSSRLVTGKDPQLSSVVVKKNNLIESGGEFLLIESDGEILIGQTRTVQDFEAWSDRDFGRPARDAKSGMLPPKLARAMVNLSGADTESAILLDPFCGSGTVLMEASMLGFDRLIGSDILKKAIKDTRKNLAWLEPVAPGSSDRAVSPRLKNVALYVSPAQELELETKVDVVVTEPFLGPPQSGKETREDLKKIMADLVKLYSESFQNIYSLMKPGAGLVVSLPVFGAHRMPVLKELKKIGFQAEPISDDPRGGILYQRPRQRVKREIMKFRK